MVKLKLLIGGSSSFFFHLKAFSNKLNELGVETKLVLDTDYSDGFPSRKIKNWFQTKKQFNKLIEEFKPDAIFIDREKHFGIGALEKNIPLIVLLRGHYWSELAWYKKQYTNHFQKALRFENGIKLQKGFLTRQK